VVFIWKFIKGLSVNTKIQPQLSHWKFKERIRAIEQTENRNCTRNSSDPPPLQKISGEGGRWRQQGTYVKSKLQKTASCTVVESLMFHKSTHTHTHTSYPLPWYFRKSLVGNVFLSFFNHPLPKYQSGRYRLGFRVEADWLKCAAPQTSVNSVVHLTSIL
jgi:hypothetical protein